MNSRTRPSPLSLPITRARQDQQHLTAAGWNPQPFPQMSVVSPGLPMAVSPGMAPMPVPPNMILPSMAMPPGMRRGSADGRYVQPPPPVTIIVADPNYANSSPYATASPYAITPTRLPLATQQQLSGSSLSSGGRSPAYPPPTATTKGGRERDTKTQKHVSAQGVTEQPKPQAGMFARARQAQAQTQTQGAERKSSHSGNAHGASSHGGGNTHGGNGQGGNPGLAGSQVDSWDAFCCCFGDFFESLCGCCAPSGNGKKRGPQAH